MELILENLIDFINNELLEPVCFNVVCIDILKVYLFYLQEQCRTMGGYLVKIEDVSEHNWVVTNIKGILLSYS